CRDCRQGRSPHGRGRGSLAAVRSCRLTGLLPEPHRRDCDRTVAGGGHLHARRRRHQTSSRRDGNAPCRHLPICSREGLTVMSTPSTRVMHRSLRATPPKAVSGEGVWLVTESGPRVLDASGGAAVSCLGHQHPRVLEAMKRQADKLAYAHTAFFASAPAEELAERLVGHEPGGLAYVYYVSGGSEAVEASLKIARQYFVERGEPQRTHFIARRPRPDTQ